MIAHHDKCEIHIGQEIYCYACAHNSRHFSGIPKINQPEIQEKIFTIDPKYACKPKTQVGSFWIFQEYRKFNDELSGLKTKYYIARKKEIKNEVDRVLNYVNFQRATTEEKLKKNIKSRVFEAIALAENLYKTHHSQKSDEEIKTLIREALRPLRFNDNRGYFFIYDMKGNNILLPAFPKLEGRNLWNLKDSRGDYNIRRFVRILQEKGEGFLHWYWYKPDRRDVMSEKIGFSKVFKPLNWWIGTGEYLEDYRKNIQRDVLEWINKIRFGRDGYIFVYDFHANTLAHFKEKNIGVNRWNFKDSSGQYVVRKLIEISQKEGGGYLDYVGTIRPSTGKPAAKIGYAKAVKDWNWMVGAGLYVDSINDVIMARQKALGRKIRASILTILAILVTSFVCICFISRIISRKIAKNIAIFSYFFEQAVTESARISDESVYFSEFKQLARSANTMVDERKRAADAFERLQKQLQQAQKMEAIGTLAGGIAHDFNNILAAILGYAEMAKDDSPPDSSVAKDLEKVLDAGFRAKELVQQILSFSRQADTQCIHVQPATIVNEVIKMLRPSLPSTIKINSEISPHVETIFVDPTRVHQVIMNLCTNAFHAMEENGGTLDIILQEKILDEKTIKEQELSGKAGVYIELIVRDTGQGISPAIRDRIFDPYFTTKEQGKGTGMGLATVHGIVKSYGGFILLESEPGKGTAVHVFFPVGNREVTPGKNWAESLASGNERILFIDDEDILAEMGRDVLKRLGYRVTVRTDSLTALETFQNQPDQFDVVITDQTMPGMTGTELARKMMLIRPDIPIILCTGYSTVVSEAKAKSMGIREFALKPLSKKDIAALIRKVLD